MNTGLQRGQASTIVPADAISEVGRGLVETARDLVLPEQPIRGARLADLYTALKGLRVIQRIHRSFVKGLQEDEITREKLAKSKLETDVARKKRGAAAAKFRTACLVEEITAGTRVDKQIRREKGRAEIALAEARIESVRTRTRLAEERHEAEYPRVPDDEPVAAAAQDTSAETVEQYLARRATEENALPVAPTAGCAHADAGDVPPVGCGGPGESDAARSGVGDPARAEAP